MTDDILTQALAAATFVKIITDLVKMAQDPLPSWVLPFVAVCVGVVATLLLRLATGELLTMAVGAQCILAGVLAGGTAVGVTRLHDKARGA